MLDRAGRIDDSPARFEADEGVFENFSLGDSDFFDVWSLQAPTHIDATADHSGIRARDVEEDRIECPVPFGRSGMRPVVHGDGGITGVET